MEYQQAQYADLSATEYAGVWVRFLSTLIDSIIIGAVSGGINTVAAAMHNSSVISILAVTIGTCSISTLLYFTVMEATQGATLGKKALGLRVVKIDGSSPIGWSASIIRNLVRIIDALFVYLVGAIIIWKSPIRQRLGDKAANTIVIRNVVIRTVIFRNYENNPSFRNYENNPSFRTYENNPNL